MKHTKSWFLLYIVSGYNNDEYCTQENKNQTDWVLHILDQKETQPKNYNIFSYISI